jgi:hypothetical protein
LNKAGLDRLQFKPEFSGKLLCATVNGDNLGESIENSIDVGQFVECHPHYEKKAEQSDHDEAAHSDHDEAGQSNRIRESRDAEENEEKVEIRLRVEVLPSDDFAAHVRARVVMPENSAEHPLRSMCVRKPLQTVLEM